MIYIAHRGLIHGPDADTENTPLQIESALELGYDAEVDVWCKDNKFYLGHDEPKHEVSYIWLCTPGLWIHAKNLQALVKLQNLNVFWHENDAHTLTSKGYIWSFPGELTSASNGIMVMPEHANIAFDHIHSLSCYGVCSDYIKEIEMSKNINRGI